MAADKKGVSKYKASEAEKEKYIVELDDLDNRISRLRVLYDQYFMGIERLEPQQQRTVVSKILRRSVIGNRGSTVLKFRFRSLQQRFVSYCSYWDRIVRLIEDGHIRRGITGAGGGLGSGENARAGDGDQRFVPAQSLQSKRRRFRQRDKPEEAAPESTPPRNEFRPDEVEALYDRFVEEKKRAGEPTEKVTRSVVEKSVKRIVDHVKKEGLMLRIIEKNGKVNLTAVIKKK